MNRRTASVLAAVAVVGLAAVGVYAGLPGGASPSPETPGTVTETPTASPAATPTTTATPTSDGPVELSTGEDSRLVLKTAAGQVVRGETTLDAGTTLLVRLKSTDSAHPFLYSTEATVGSNGSFEATFDLSSVEGSGTFEVLVRHDGEVLLNRTGRLEDTGSDADGTENASSGANDRSGQEDGPYAAFVTTDGGNLTLRAASGQVVRGETDLPTGTKLRVRLRSSDVQNPFLLTAETTVESDGTFRARFNASGLEGGTAFTAAVLRDGDTLATAPGEVVAAEPHAEAAFTYEGDRLALASARGQVVTGKTDLAAGETVRVRMHGAGSTPFIKSRKVTVGTNGTFEATFDMSDISEGTTFRAFVSHDGERLTEVPGEVTADG